MAREYTWIAGEGVRPSRDPSDRRTGIWSNTGLDALAGLDIGTEFVAGPPGWPTSSTYSTLKECAVLSLPLSKPYLNGTVFSGGAAVSWRL